CEERVRGRAGWGGEEEAGHAPAGAGARVEAPADVGRAALLPALEDERAHAAERLALRLERGVDVALRAVEDERLDRAALGADAQDFLGEERVILVEPSADFLARFVRRDFAAAPAAAVDRGPVRIELARLAAERLGDLRQEAGKPRLSLLDEGERALRHARGSRELDSRHVRVSARGLNGFSVDHGVALVG